MRKTIFVIIALLGIGFGAKAQIPVDPNFSIGVKGGATISKQMFSPSVEQTMLPGFMGGVMLRYIEEKYFGIIAEVNFEQRGWKEKFKETPFYYQRRLSYVHVPLLAHIYFGKERLKFFFNAGPEIAFLIGEASDANFDYHNPSGVEGLPLENRNTAQFTMDIKNKIDYGISAGLGTEVNLNKRNSFVLEGRFYYGLNNIFGANKKDIFAASNSISIMVSLGYMFRVK